MEPQLKRGFDMDKLLTLLIENSPTLGTFLVLLYVILKQGHKMDLGFTNLNHKIDTEINKLRGEMTEGFLKVDQRFLMVDQRFLEVDYRFQKIEALDIKAEFKEIRKDISEIKVRLRDIDHRVEKTA